MWLAGFSLATSPALHAQEWRRVLGRSGLIARGTDHQILIQYARGFHLGNASRSQSLLQVHQQLRTLVEIESMIAIERQYTTDKITLRSRQASELFRVVLLHLMAV